MRKFYISGPISMIAAEFGMNEVERRFKAAVNEVECDHYEYIDDMEIINPAAYEIENGTQEEYMKHWHDVLHNGDIDGIYFLEGWEDSAGATQEHEWAMKLNIKVEGVITLDSISYSLTA